MKKIKEFVKKIYENKIYRIVCLGIIAILAVGITLIVIKSNDEKVDTTYLIATLERASELTTAKINYKGITTYESSGIAIINKTGFVMEYQATARTGIDVNEVEIKANDITKEVIVTIPRAKILDVKVAADSIKYYDEKFSIFNIDKKEEANKAQAQAEKIAKEEIQKMGVLELADNQSETLIKGLIQELIPEEYKLVFKIKE